MTIRLRDALNQQSTLITEIGLTDTFLVLDGATIRKIAPANMTVDWTKILNKPTTFPPEVHNHDTLYEPKNANIQAHISNISDPHDTQWDQLGGTLTKLPFNTGLPVQTLGAGEVAWNPDERTYDMGINGVTLQAGQEDLINVRNNTLSNIPNGTVCMYTGTVGASGRITVAPMDGTNPANASLILGIATENIEAGTDGFITVFGKVRNIDTSAWSEGAILYTSTTVAGGLTNIEPETGINQPIAVVINSHTTVGTVFVRIETLDHNHFEPANTNIQSHISSTSNPHSVTKTQIGLENVLNKEQKVYHGFVDKTNSTLSFDNSTRTFTLGTSTSYSVYINGTKITKSTNLSVQIGTGLGQHFIWFTAAGTLATSQTVWSLLDTSVTPVATVYWTGIIGIVAEERHDYRRNLIEHNNQHDSWGTQYVSGFTNTPTFTNANTFTFTGGVIRDEDIYIAISSPQTQAMLGYRAVGGTFMLFDTASTAYVKLNGTTPQYDNVGTLTNIPVAQYGVQWVYATNRIATPISIIVGQGTYLSVAAAQAAPMPTLAGFSVAEWKLLYRVIIRNNAGTLQYIQADTLYNVSTGPAIQGSSISTVSASNVTFIPSGDLIATNVQNALIELDTEKAPSAKGVTNGDSHDHNGGDGAQINHTTLSNIGTNTHAQIDTFITSKAQANGIASLDAGGKVPISQLPSSIMEYKGVWDATTNIPILADGVGNTGDVYRVSVAGTQNLGSGNITFEVGDYTVYNGTAWEKSDTTDAVASVNGKTGIIVLTATDVGAEPTISVKNTAFNKNYGTTATDVKMNGIQAVGTVDEIARIDHIHPTDTSKADKSATVLSDTLTVNTDALVVNSAKRVTIGVTDDGARKLQAGSFAVGSGRKFLAGVVNGSVQLKTASTDAAWAAGYRFDAYTTDTSLGGLFAYGADKDAIDYLTLGNAYSDSKFRVKMGSGNVLINTTTDDGVNKIQVNGSTSIAGWLALKGSAPTIYNAQGTADRILITGSTDGSAASGGGIVLRGSTAPVNPSGIELYAGSVERLRVTSAGNVLVGTTTDVSSTLHVVQTTGVVASFRSDGPDTARLWRWQSTIGAAAGRLLLGALNSNSSQVDYASIGGLIQTSTAGSHSGALTFYTYNSGLNDERMRITSTGNLLIGTTTDDGVNKLQVNGGIAFNPTTTTIAPSAGGAGALPATPTGYATVYIGGVSRKIAYY